MGKKHSILIASLDPYLAGIYGRKFELDNWDVEIAESLNEVEQKASLSRPEIIILDDALSEDMVGNIKMLRALPTLTTTRIVMLAKITEPEKIEKARQAGAVDYLIEGHFVPQEAVEKMRNLLEA
ncbi:hypothetical protein KJ766_00805 [Patescibacteria group bacterium]|nr:hypothetical protein [Patescibacteria group bacterium]